MIDGVVGGVRSTLWLLLAAAGVVLLIVCANVASVVLARGEERMREVAIRTAMGAGRWRIVRLLLSESLLLSLGGGLLGTSFALASTELLLDLDAGGIPRADAVGMDAPVLLFACGATFLTALLFGLFPALHGAADDAQSKLRDGTRATGASRGRVHFRRGLVVAQVALSFVLVLGAGLMLKSFAALLSVDLGYRTGGLLVAGLSLPQAAYADPASVDAFYDELLARVRAVDHVESASAAAHLPLDNAPGVWDFRREGMPPPAEGEPAWNAAFSAVRAGFFETMGVALRRGRLFEPSDDAGSMLVAVINEAMARKFFAGEDPLGQRLMICCPDEGQEAPWMTVVGIVADIRYEGLDSDARPAYYAPQEQTARANDGFVFRSMSVVARVDGDPAAAAPAFRDIVRDLDPDLPVVGLRTMDDVVSTSVARPRFVATLLGLFGAVALLLGAAGIYGTLAYVVAQRTLEIGVRQALGARPVSVAGMVVLHGMLLVGAGVAIGTAASYWVTRLLSGLLFGVGPLDAATYAEALVVLVLVALTACALPALRAIRISPLVAMRDE
jgi:putative ABC transport system permease protein